LVRVVQEVVQVGRSREVTEIKLCFNSCGNVRALTVNAQHLSTRAFPGESTSLEIYTLSMAPRKFCLPQALKLCALEIQALRIVTLKVSSCELLSSRPSYCYLRSPRRFYHPQAPTLCALELHAATFTLRHPPRRFYHHQALKLCAVEIQALRIAILKFSSCAPSKSKPSGLLPSRSQAVSSRAPDLPIATFYLLGNFTTLKLPSGCAPLSARPSSWLPSTSSAILQPWKFSSCMPSSSKL
jgi:hypothetical protein